RAAAHGERQPLIGFTEMSYKRTFISARFTDEAKGERTIMTRTLSICMAVTLAVAALAAGAHAKESKQKMKPEKQAFGKLPDGTAVDLYTLTNANGIEMKVMTYGGIVISL